MERNVINDPMFGSLRWDREAGEWRGLVMFTPKHPVALVYLGPPPGRGRRVLAQRCHIAYLSHRVREWAYRLEIAKTLIAASQFEPHIEEELDTLDDPEVVARCLMLDEIEMEPSRQESWQYLLGRRDGITIALELNADGIESIEF